MAEDKERFSSDRPLTRPEDDRLGYARFAETVAESLSRMAPVGGFVVGIYGPWGSGKTTVLNFVQSYLRRADPQGGLRVVQFNPWWFSGQEDLTIRFMEQLLAAVEPTGRRRATDIRNAAATFAEYVGEAPSLVGSGGRVPLGLCVRVHRTSIQ